MNGEDARQELVGHLAGALSNEGVSLLKSDPGLTREAVELVNLMVNDRPSYVLESEDCDKTTMMAGVALGMALQKSQEKIERAGGFESLTQTLVEGGLGAVMAQVNATR